MAFVNLSLLLGGAAIGIPIVLHLIMRQKPKAVLFPAIMFLIERKESNRRRLQIRHWVLLALRILAVLLLALVLARPSVASALVGNWIIIVVLAMLCAFSAVVAGFAWLEKKSRAIAIGATAVAGAFLLSCLVMFILTLWQDPGVRIGDEQTPVAAVLLIDTAPRMQYQHHNQSRLEEAKKLADWLLTQLPRGSDIAVADTNLGASVFAVDSGAARKTLEGLQVDAASRPLTQLLSQSLDLLESSEYARRELYLLSDVTHGAWPTDSVAAVSSRVQDSENLSIYVIDVGVERPANFLLGDVSLSQEVLPRNGTLEVATQLLHVGSGGERVVELEIEKYQPELPILVDGKPKYPEIDYTKRRRQTVKVGKDGSAAIAFSVAGLDIGTHQGRIQLDRPDGLPIDDVRYFTFEVRQPWPVLIAHGPGANPALLAEALAPFEFRVTDQARFRTQVIPISQLRGRKLDEFAIVCVLDPPALPVSSWQQLAAYVQDGGNVAIFLGHNAVKKSFNDAPAQELLPGRLDRQWRSGARPDEFDGQADLYLAPRPAEHPMLSAFREISANVPWYEFPVFRHWSFEGSQLADGSRVIVSFNNAQPAIVERRLGTGRVLAMTTPISDLARPRGREPWNWLPTGFEPWPYVMLINETMLYLAGSGDEKLNYESGQTAELPTRGNDDRQALLVFSPWGDRPNTVRAMGGRIRLPYTAAPGAYRIKGTEDQQLYGFSVNLPVAASNMTRIDKTQLDQWLGEENYQIAREQAEIIREQGQQRMGREFFPFLLIVVLLIFGSEAVLANRFYRAD